MSSLGSILSCWSWKEPNFSRLPTILKASQCRCCNSSVRSPLPTSKTEMSVLSPTCLQIYSGHLACDSCQMLSSASAENCQSPLGRCRTKHTKLSPLHGRVFLIVRCPFMEKAPSGVPTKFSVYMPTQRGCPPVPSRPVCPPPPCVGKNCNLGLGN